MQAIQVQSAKCRMSGLSEQQCNALTVDSHGITLEVEETDDWWHCLIGKKLANEWGMRHYCNPRHSAADVHVDDAI